MERFSAQFGLQSIINKTVNLASENEISTSKFDTENLKAIISGDRTQISIKYNSPIDYSPVCKLVFLVNSLPNSKDVSYGFLRKLLIIPFTRRFEEAEQDKSLIDKLIPELSGILNWALDGLVRLRKNTYIFSNCQACEDAHLEYKNQINPVIRFVNECLDFTSSKKISKKSILDNYDSWLKNQGIYDHDSVSSQKFWKCFRAATEGMLLNPKRTRGCDFFDGLSLKDEYLRGGEGGIDFT